MSMFKPGSYRGSADGLVVDVRVECDGGGVPVIVSGDCTRDGVFIATFVCTAPRSPGHDPCVLEGAIFFRGSLDLTSGRMRLQMDARGTGTFFLGIDMEGGHEDTFAGRLDWNGSSMRRLRIEIDGVLGAEPPGGYMSRRGALVDVRQAFESAGFEVEIVVDPFHGDGLRRGWSLAELHRAMEQRRAGAAADTLAVHAFVCGSLAGRDGDSVLGVMYDFGMHDLNNAAREGVAVFYAHGLLSDPRTPEEIRRREYVYTLVHEIGHALNLQHSFEKGRPAALSWMNYPDFYPRGRDRGPDWDGTREFWNQFEECFDLEELRHLWHATPREIRAGGFDFGVYEEGASPGFGGQASPRRTRLGANPMRMMPGIHLSFTNPKRETPGRGRTGAIEFDLGEPVFLDFTVQNRGSAAAVVPTALDPMDGFVRVEITTPSGRTVRYRPPVSLCRSPGARVLHPDEAVSNDAGLALFLGHRGAIFTEPGTYLVRAHLSGIDGGRVGFSEPTPIVVRHPDRATAAAAERVYADRKALAAMYLRHPLAFKSEWERMREQIGRERLSPEHTLPVYIDYLDGLGWATPFREPGGEHKPVNASNARAAFERARGAGAAVDRLPLSVRKRLDDIPAGRAKAAPAAATELVRPVDRLRAEVPAEGLFGFEGLRSGGDAAGGPGFRVVNTLRGSGRFADIVSWNIEHLHQEHHRRKIPRVAELIRTFRCDFWGLQEVDADALEELTRALNASGRVRYAFRAPERSGQQCAVLYRSDSTRVSPRMVRAADFTEEVSVVLTSGEREKRKAFLRPPFIADVRVEQSAGAFDFVAIVVHFKSTDSKLKDKGASMREHEAKKVAAWIRADRGTGPERDYIVLGDMNAETLDQGLGPVSADGLKRLSVGMKERYGSDQALTRVGSRRFLDHIVVTADTAALIPPEDENEQIVIRTDRVVSGFTEGLSDHVPVAVRVILGADSDPAARAAGPRPAANPASPVAARKTKRRGTR